MKQLLLTYLPVISGVLITISYWPQLIKTLKTKNVDGQSLGFWSILSAALVGTTLQQLGLIIYNGVTNYAGLITQAINLFFAVWMMINVIRYRNRRTRLKAIKKQKIRARKKRLKNDKKQ